MSNEPTRTETALQRLRRVEAELTARGNQLTTVQAERDRAVAELDRVMEEKAEIAERLDAYIDDGPDSIRGPLIAALHVFHDRYHGGTFRQCWNDPCGSVAFDRNSTSPHAGPAPTSLPLVVVPMMESA